MRIELSKEECFTILSNYLIDKYHNIELNDGTEFHWRDYIGDGFVYEK